MSTSGLVTILFTDLVGSTELNSDIGDMAADELRGLHFIDLREAIDATNGVEVKTIGDAIMASYSGAAEALNGAVEMQRAVDIRNHRSAGQDLHMRVGVSAGDATFEDGDWFGTPVVEAARLCAAAEADQILVSDLVKALAGSRVDHSLNSLGQRELKGLPHPIDVSEVEWTKEVVESGVPLPGFVDTNPTFSFAGRAPEHEVVRTAWKEARDGHRRAVLISGEPGIGKTRLVTEFVRTAHDEGGLVLWGRCDEELDVPFQPFAEALSQYVSAINDDRLLADVGPVAADIAKLVPSLHNRIPGIGSAPSADADAERHRLFESVAEVLAVTATSDPIVIVLDDIHWADRPSLLLLKHLLRRPGQTRLLVLATYRDTDLDRSHPLSDVLADLRRESGVERLDLKGLDAGEVTSFMAAAAGHELEPEAADLAKAIHTETEGNPFFLGEMIRHLAESGMIVQREGKWVSDYRLEDVGIPEGIREVIGRRLSNLSEAANTALRIAAVIGPEFDISTIEAVGGPVDDALFDALDEAVTAGVAREVKGAFGRYAFAHALMRSTLYEELSTNRRVRMHWRIGQAVEARYKSDTSRHVDLLAHHFYEGALAGDPLVAIKYSVKAAERALSELAHEAAVKSYERALSAFELIDDPDLAARCDIETALASTLRQIGEPRWRDAVFTAAATARAAGDRERLASAVIAIAAEVPAEIGLVDAELVALIREALDATDPAPSARRATLQSMLAMELIWGPHVEERTALAREALEMAREVGDPDVLAAILSSTWTLVDCTQPFIAKLHEYGSEALSVAPPSSSSWMYSTRMVVASCAALGDTGTARAHQDAFTSAAKESRLTRFIWMAKNDKAMLDGHAGELEAAEIGATDAVTLGQQVGLPESMVAGFFGALLYQIRQAQGRIGELVPTLEGLVESQPGLPVWRLALCGALALSWRVEEAQEHFVFLARDDCAHIPSDVEYPVTLGGLARLAPTIDAPVALCGPVYERLLPFAGTFNFTGTSIGDPNDIGLACVADQLGRFDDSDRHFAAALDLAVRADALPTRVQCHSDWARMLDRRGDRTRALEQASLALELAKGRGMDGPDGYVARALNVVNGA
jgi:class 3 adenylate cyclase